MCRFVAYLGPPVTLESLLLAPDHSLLRQAWAPRFQRHGTVNADGFGVGWYDLERRPEPAVYRSTRPMWGDRSFASLAGLVSSRAVLAVLRDATPPAVAEESGTPPFGDGAWLFAHNGAIDGFRNGVGAALRRMLSNRRLGGLQGATDSEVLFGLILDRIDAGACPSEAMTSVIDSVARLAGGRMNMVMTDGARMAATTWGDSLYTLADQQGDGPGVGSRVIASEPFDDDPAWRPVPDRRVVEAGPEGIHVVPMERVQEHVERTGGVQTEPENRRAAHAADNEPGPPESETTSQGGAA